MSKEKRKKPRRTIRYTAWVGISKELPLRGCVVSDISETGAKLELKNVADLPEAFTLLLTGRGQLHRRCHAVWRTEHHIGVHFDKSEAQPARDELETAF
jgi:hypothetical protein